MSLMKYSQRLGFWREEEAHEQVCIERGHLVAHDLEVVLRVEEVIVGKVELVELDEN